MVEILDHTNLPQLGLKNSSKGTEMQETNRIEFREEFRIGMFDDGESLSKEIATLTRISRPIGGNSDLPVWGGIELGVPGRMAYNLRTPKVGLIYSPRLFGRQLDMDNWDDCVCAYSVFFDFFKNNEWDVEEIQARFAYHHSAFCKWNFDDLYQTWTASTERQRLLHAPIAIGKKIQFCFKCQY